MKMVIIAIIIITICLSLAEENKRNLDEFEYTSMSIKNSLNTCKDRLKERTEKISLYGYYSKERIGK